MHTLTYTPDPTNEFEHIISTITTSAELLGDVLEAVERHLTAAGFILDGQHLDVVDDKTGEVVAARKRGDDDDYVDLSDWFAAAKAAIKKYDTSGVDQEPVPHEHRGCGCQPSEGRKS